MATVTKLQPYGDNIAVLFSDGSRVMAYRSNHNGLWYVAPNENAITVIREFGNQLVLTIDGESVFAFPGINHWYVGPNDEPYTPPLFLWPFSLASSNPAHGFPDDWFHTPGRPTHNGGDFGYPPGGFDGNLIGSAGAGTVIFSGTDGSYGYVVTVYHGTYNGRDWSTLYAHMQAGTNIANGTNVGVGQTLGLVGNTGGSTGPHLHFETRENGIPIDPASFMAEFNPTNAYVRP